MWRLGRTGRACARGGNGELERHPQARLLAVNGQCPGERPEYASVAPGRPQPRQPPTSASLAPACTSLATASAYTLSRATRSNPSASLAGTPYLQRRVPWLELRIMHACGEMPTPVCAAASGMPCAPARPDSARLGAARADAGGWMHRSQARVELLRMRAWPAAGLTRFWTPPGAGS